MENSAISGASRTKLADEHPDEHPQFLAAAHLFLVCFETIIETRQD